jgi:hypothetical protein
MNAVVLLELIELGGEDFVHDVHEYFLVAL